MFIKYWDYIVAVPAVLFGFIFFLNGIMATASMIVLQFFSLTRFSTLVWMAEICDTTLNNNIISCVLALFFGALWLAFFLYETEDEKMKRAGRIGLAMLALLLFSIFVEIEKIKMRAVVVEQFEGSFLKNFDNNLKTPNNAAKAFAAAFHSYMHIHGCCSFRNHTDQMYTNFDMSMCPIIDNTNYWTSYGECFNSLFRPHIHYDRYSQFLLRFAYFLFTFIAIYRVLRTYYILPENSVEREIGKKFFNASDCAPPVPKKKIPTMGSIRRFIKS